MAVQWNMLRPVQAEPFDVGPILQEVRAGADARFKEGQRNALKAAGDAYAAGDKVGAVNMLRAGGLWSEANSADQNTRAAEMHPLDMASRSATTAASIGGERRAETLLPETIASTRASTDASRASAASTRSGMRRADELHVPALEAARETSTITGRMGAYDRVVPPVPGAPPDTRRPSYALTGTLPPPLESTYASAFDKEAAKKAADELNEADKASASAGTLLGSISTMKPLVDRAYTGTGAGIKEMAARFALMMGVSPESIKSAVSATELLNSGLTQLTIGMAAPLKPVSNVDMQIIQKAAGSASLSPDGLKDVLGATEAVARRTQIYNQLLRQAMNSSSRGREVDRSAIAEEALRRVPAYTPLSGRGPGSGAAGSALPPPTVGEIRDGYSYRGGDPSNPSSWLKVGGR